MAGNIAGGVVATVVAVTGMRFGMEHSLVADLGNRAAVAGIQLVELGMPVAAVDSRVVGLGRRAVVAHSLAVVGARKDIPVVWENNRFDLDHRNNSS